ncbi:VOC family protein [Pseudomonas sp. NA-150]|uniref:VOC family protein n=1 Tax=Pseudomonas sp. NA-150 TaxID=3367525 RepID=UPI0037CBB071
MKLNTYLIFDGQCEAAFKHYAQALNGNLAMMMRFGEGPESAKLAEQDKNRIMHVRLEVGDQALMGSDTTADYPFQGSKGFSVSVNVNSVAEAERVFSALEAGGSVTMPLSKTFWAERFGMLTDRFGVAWMVNCESA